MAWRHTFYIYYFERVKNMIEYKGEEFLYLVEISTASGDELVRPFNQQEGSHSGEADSIDLASKDKSGSDYGNVTESLELNGILTQGDPFPKYAWGALRQKKMLPITKVNTRTLEAEKGLYKIDSFEESYSNGEFASYSLSATLNGDVTELTMTEAEVPDGAPAEGTQEQV